MSTDKENKTLELLKECLPFLEVVRDYEPGEPDGACLPNRAAALHQAIAERITASRQPEPPKPEGAPAAEQNSNEALGSKMCEQDGRHRCRFCGEVWHTKFPSPAQEKPVAASVEEWETTGSDGVYGNVTDKLTGEKIFVYVDLRNCGRAVTAHNAALARHSAAKDREIERLTTEAHLSHQAATDNKDWFDSLVNDLADKLGCGRFPTAILDRVAALRQDKERLEKKA